MNNYIINSVIKKLKENNIILLNKEVSPELKYHVKNNIPISENIFRLGSKKNILLFKEVRNLLNEENIIVNNYNDLTLIEETDIGDFDYYNGKLVPLDCPFEYTLSEAEYKGKKVKLNSPKRSSDGKKKYYVYTKKPAKKTKRNPKGYTVVKVGFGAPGMKIAKSLKARKSFLARHRCDTNAGPKWKARYWACNIHKYKKQLGLKFPGRW
tara:strand:- start:92 stop:721 length:630 start_codon:yes stop_codon:yes gene_type:complete